MQWHVARLCWVPECPVETRGRTGSRPSGLLQHRCDAACLERHGWGKGGVCVCGGGGGTTYMWVSTHEVHDPTQSALVPNKCEYLMRRTQVERLAHRAKAFECLKGGRSPDTSLWAMHRHGKDN